MHCLTSRNESPCKAQQTWTISIFKHFLPYCVFFNDLSYIFSSSYLQKMTFSNEKKLHFYLPNCKMKKFVLQAADNDKIYVHLIWKRQNIPFCIYVIIFLFFGGGVKNKMTHSVCLSWLVWPTLYKMSLWLNRLFPAQNTTFNSPTML